VSADPHPPGSSGRSGHLPIPPPPGAPRRTPRPPVPPPAPPRAVGQPGHVLPARPLTLADTIEGTLRLSGRIFWRTALVVLLVVGPFQLLSSYVVAQVMPPTITPAALLGDQPAFTPSELLERFGAWTVVLQVLGLLVHLVALSVAVGLVLQADRGEPPSARGVLRVVADRSGATVGGSVLLLGAALLLVVFVLPAVVVLAAVPIVGPVLGLGLGAAVAAVVVGAFLLVVPAATVDDRGAWTTFRQVLTIVRRRVRRVLAVVALLLPVLLVALLTSIPVLVLASALGPPAWVADALVSTVVTAVGLPVAAVAGLLLLHDARARGAVAGSTS
jgi:hypothetical protein